MGTIARIALTVSLAAALAGGVAARTSMAATRLPDPSAAPLVSTQPDLVIVPGAGYAATFTAAATGNPAPTVIWQVANSSNGPWRDLPGYTSTTLTFTATSASLGHAYRALFTNSSATVATRPAKLVSRSNWMGELGSDISNVPLTELTIPGSHDMGTYTLPGDVQSADYQATACSYVPDPVCDSYSRAQSRMATTELNDGIRYFDLRVCGNGPLPANPFPHDFATMSVNPVACHGLVGAPLATILAQTRDWVRAHPSELVILDFNHHFQIDPYMEGSQIEAALTYSDGRSMLIPPQYCTPSDPNSGTCAGGLTLADVGPQKMGNIIVNFENDGAPGKTVRDAQFRDYDIQPILRYDFYDHHSLFWGRTDEPPYSGKYCTTATAFASCFGNTDVSADALNSDRNTTSTRQTFAEPHPAYTFQHFFVQFLQTTPDGEYMATNSDRSLLDMAMDSNPIVGPGFFGCNEWGITDCFAQYRPENINIVALNFYERTQYTVVNEPLTFDFVAEMIKFDEYARTAPVVTIAPQAQPAATGWYNSATLGGLAAPLPVSISASDYHYPTGISALDCQDNAVGFLTGATVPTTATTVTGSTTLSDGIHNLDCRSADGAYLGSHQQGNRGAGPGSTGLPLKLQVDSTPPLISCPKGTLILNQPVTSLTATVYDATSGPTVPSISFPVSTAHIGTFTTSLTASDIAGNTTTGTCTYTVKYAIAYGYDPKQPIKVGTTAPISVFLRDYSGRNILKLSVTAKYVISVAPCPIGTIGGCVPKKLTPTPAGPDKSIRTFTPLTGGAYEYDLATTGYAAGNYALVFTVDPSPVLYDALFTVSK